MVGFLMQIHIRFKPKILGNKIKEFVFGAA